ncbi:DUF4190 domain-containing protein [Cellulomonas sp. NPDC055163]
MSAAPGPQPSGPGPARPGDPFASSAEPYYAPGWEAPAVPVEPTAWASVVVGVLGGGPVALVLGLVARARVRSRGRRGGRLALAGIALGVLGTLAWTGVVMGSVLTSRAERPLAGDVDARREVHARQLVTGVCLAELPPDGPVDTVTAVPCADPHAAEVVTQYAFSQDAVWPGQESADARVASACALSDAEVEQGVRPVTWAPTEQSWGRGDRSGVCLATVEGGGITGSFLDGTVTLP